MPFEASGAKPNEVSVTLDKANPSGSDDIYIGQTEIVFMTIKFPAGNTQGMILINPLPDNKILDWSKLKQIADDILKCI